MADGAVICVGNRSRCDDAVGPLVADELARHHLDVPVHLSDGEPGELLDLWAGLGRVVVVDAVLTGRNKPGTVYVLNASTEPIEISSQASSHGLGLAESIELARSLHQLPADLRVVGIEAGSLEAGEAITPAVRKAIPHAVAQVLVEMRDA